MSTTNNLSQSGYIIRFIRSLLFSIGMISSAVAWAPVVILAAPLPYQRRHWLAQHWARFIIWWLDKTCQIDYRISGLENLPSGPAVVLAKHQSTWETVFLFSQLPPQAWVIKKELLRIPFFGWALALLDPIAIDRKAGSRALKQVLQQGREHLKKGHWLVIFPEGTRVPPGVRGRYGAAGARLAADSACPIVPIAHNAGEFWPRGGFLKRPGTVQIVIGPAIDSQDQKAQQLNMRVEEWIESTMKDISKLHSYPSSPETAKS